MSEQLDTPWIVVIVLCVALAGLLVYVFVRPGGLPRFTRARQRRRPHTEEYEIIRQAGRRGQDRYARGTGLSPIEPDRTYRSANW